MIGSQGFQAMNHCETGKRAAESTTATTAVPYATRWLSQMPA